MGDFEKIRRFDPKTTEALSKFHSGYYSHGDGQTVRDPDRANSITSKDIKLFGHATKQQRREQAFSTYYNHNIRPGDIDLNVPGTEMKDWNKGYKHYYENKKQGEN